ncbi:MAG: MogA/MoaB family molybdenum cofactor biosynthesis protein [Candidatus Hydrogenedentes bacterium]|nr:MogA/MoaB family molybdenum cofactor biosynthesis protein [Candidatus Hydrogenedentota bacterium]
MLGAAIVTISDSTAAGKREDKSGDAIEAMLSEIPARLVTRIVVPDEEDRIYEELKNLCTRDDVHLVLTTGGTGVGPRDVTVEATRRVLEKELPGIAEAIRAYGIQRARTAMLSRAVAGVAGDTVLVNLPGSEKGASESLRAVIDVLHHAVDMAAGGGH